MDVRTCRVCMQTEGKEKFTQIFEENAEKALEIFLVAGVLVVECQEAPALICKRCTKDLVTAVKFRNQCRSTNSSLRSKLLSFETAKWTAELQSFLEKHTTVPVKEEQIIVSLKPEPIDSDDHADVDDFFFSNDFHESPVEDEIVPEQLTPEKKKTGANSFDCEQCNYKTNSKRNLSIHIQVRHSGHQGFKCHLCGATVLRKGSLKRHLRDKHAVTTLKFEPKGCPYCMELFEDFHALRQHVKDKHEAYRRVICDKCGKNFENKRKALKHLSTIHKEKSSDQIPTTVNTEKRLNICFTCGKAFKKPWQLRAHERNHRVWLPEDYFYCDVCGNKFKDKSQMSLHIRNKHILKVRYPCELCPGRSYIKKDDLKKHIKVFHHNIKEFKCEYCGKDFGNKRKMKIHIRIHTGEQPYQCDICFTKFTHQTDYRRHKWAHEGRKSYKCQICGDGFNKRSELNSHRNRHQEFSLEHAVVYY